MRHFYTLRCPAPFWLIRCKPYRNRFITAKVIDKSLGARFLWPTVYNKQVYLVYGSCFHEALPPQPYVRDSHKLEYKYTTCHATAAMKGKNQCHWSSVAKVAWECIVRFILRGCEKAWVHSHVVAVERS